MSDWRPPAGMTPQAHPRTNAGLPLEGIRDLLDRIDRTKRELNEATNRLLMSAGISVSPAGMVIDSSLTVNGDLAVPNGSITNEALANPVTFAGNSGSLTSTVPPDAWATACSADLVVPEWAGSGVVLAVGSVAGTTGASGGSLYGAISIAGDVGGTTARYVALNDSDTLPISHQLTFAPGGTTVSVDMLWKRSGTGFVGGAAYLTVIGVFGR